MQLKALTAAVVFAVSLPALAQSADPVAGVPHSPEAAAGMMWDFSRNAAVLKDPKAFVPFVAQATEPTFPLALGYQMMDPSSWLTLLSSMTSPAAYAAWVPLMTDPAVAAAWMTAAADPNFGTALLTQFTDPGKLMRWAMSPMDPKLWGLLAQTINPAVYMKWLMAPLDPRWTQIAMSPLNPAVYLAWLGMVSNPAVYGDVWKGLAAPQGGAPLYPGFDPNAWTRLWQTLPLPATPTPPAR